MRTLRNRLRMARMILTGTWLLLAGIFHPHKEN